MPAATDISDVAAVQHLHAKLDEIGDLVDAERDDISFLKAFLANPALHSLIQANEELEDEGLGNPLHNACRANAADVIQVIKDRIATDATAEELNDIIQSPHFLGLMKAHDDVAGKNYDEEPERMQLSAPFPPGIPTNTELKVVSIRKGQKESLGITVKVDERGELVIARILSGTVIDKQGLLHEGDVIKEVNGEEVHTPEHLMDLVRLTPTSITFKIIPLYAEQHARATVHMKACFTYDPLKDRLIPCKEAGLAFNDGDILQVLNSDDPNWWQAKKADEDGPAGIIPSHTLEEKRKAFVRPEYDYSKSFLCGIARRKKKKSMFSSSNNSDFDRCELMVYQEVTKMPPFDRLTLVLVGANGVGRRSLKEKIIKDASRKFGSAMPHTSRAPREGEEAGKGYYFADRDTMEDDIRNDQYLEFGEFNNNLYGTRLDTVRSIINSGKMCVLDINPASLKILKTKDFKPYVVFIAAPGTDALRMMYEEGRRRGFMKTKTASGTNALEIKTEDDFMTTINESADIERVYKSYFDQTIVNDNFDQAYRTLRTSLNSLKTQKQWIPVNWVY